MNVTQIATCLERINTQWPDTSWDNHDEDTYIAHMQPVDVNDARTALTSFTRMKTRPGVARWMQACREAAAERYSGRNICQLCDNTGWIETPNLRRHAPWCEIGPDRRHLDPGHKPDESGCHCHMVQGCRCSLGQQRDDTAAMIIEFNDDDKAGRPHPKFQAPPKQGTQGP